MITKHKAQFAKNAEAKKITVIKEIDAPLIQVWDAWTTSDQLDKWWGPKPWNAVTKKMDFKEGGHWLYYMAGPEGEKQWAKVNFEKIQAPNLFTATDNFTDEKGNPDSSMPSMHWKTSFTETSEGTKINVELSFGKKEDMEKILQSGFEQGFAIGLDQLEDFLTQE